MQWARENGAPWNSWTCAYAAQGGYLKCLRWARENGALWNGWTCLDAVIGRHSDVLHWALTHGAPWSYDSIQAYKKELQTPQFRGVAICLMKLKRGTPDTNLVTVKFIHELYTVLPLIAPLCDLVINYC